MLQSVDTHWREHLSALDHLRQGIHLRGYAQKNPTQEYKREAFDLFSMMLELVKSEVTKVLMTVHFRTGRSGAVDEPKFPAPSISSCGVGTGVAEVASAEAEAQTKMRAISPSWSARALVRGGQKVGRNDPCPCGSGKKYKHCPATRLRRSAISQAQLTLSLHADSIKI